MPIRTLHSDNDHKTYDAWIKNHPEGNLWQSLERKQYLYALQKEVRIYIAEEGGKIVGSALVMIDRTAFGYCTWDIPRGPIGEHREELLTKIIEDAKKDRCMAVYYSPYQEFLVPSSKVSKRLIHCEATRIIDLTQSEEEILAQMKPKGRYNVRVAEKHGITVQHSTDVDAYYKLAKETGERDNYTIVTKQKYEAFLHALPGSFLLLAYSPSPSPDPSPIAGLLGVLWNNQASYYYGASNHAHRTLMAPYLLQWEAMQYAKAAGCTSYDLLGICPKNSSSDHPWQGISFFKEKFGGAIVTYPPERMIVLKSVMKTFVEIKRKLF